MQTEEKKDIYMVPIEMESIVKDFLEEIYPDENVRLDFLSIYLEYRLSLHGLLFSTLTLFNKETLKTDWKKRDVLLKYAKICEEEEDWPLTLKRIRGCLIGILEE